MHKRHWYNIHKIQFDVQYLTLYNGSSIEHIRKMIWSKNGHGINVRPTHRGQQPAISWEPGTSSNPARLRSDPKNTVGIHLRVAAGSPGAQWNPWLQIIRILLWLHEELQWYLKFIIIISLVSLDSLSSSLIWLFFICFRYYILKEMQLKV